VQKKIRRGRRQKNKDETIEFLQKEMIKMRKDVEFKVSKQRRKRNSARQGLDEMGRLEMQELEDEVAHWKGANIEMEEELLKVRSEVKDWKEKAKSAGYKDENDEDSDIDDGGSIKSFKSRLSRLSKPLASTDTVVSTASVNLFDRSRRNSPGNNNSAHSRGAITLGGLWNRMTAPEPSPKDPYSSSILDN